MRPYALLAAILLVGPLYAGDEGTGTSSAAFLELGSGARPAALGEAYVGLADDAAGITYNPAGMSQMTGDQVEMTHTQWFQGMLYEDLNADFSLGSEGTVGTTVNFLSIPSLARTEQVANSSTDYSQNYVTDGNFSPYDIAVSAAYSRPLSQALLLGANVKGIQESIGGSSALGLGLDLGALYRTPIQDLQLGAAVQNLGTPMSFGGEAFDLPLDARLGASYRVFNGSTLLLMEGDWALDASPVLAMGAEYLLGDSFHLRAGYRYDSLFNPWSAGVGAALDPLNLDFSVVPYGELGLTYRATLSYQFGEPSVELSTKVAYLSSRTEGKGAKLLLQANAADQIRSWGLFVYDSSRPPNLAREFQGKGRPPDQLLWDGKLTNGSPAQPGQYWAIFSVKYRTGLPVNSSYLGLKVDNSPLSVDLQFDPTSLNPEEPDAAFVPTQFRIFLKGGEASRWKVEILDPQGRVFRTYTGQGTAPANGLFWDGKSDNGEELISNEVYQARVTVTDLTGSDVQGSSILKFRAVFR